MITAIDIVFLRESNNIEGEFDDKSLEDAICAWMWIRNKKKLTKELILDVHQILMDSRDTINDGDKGKLRNGRVWVGGREGKPSYALDSLIEEWVRNVNYHIHDNSIFAEPEVLAKEDHIVYEHIHPFFDGNGRTGRIFYNWQRLKMGLPIHIIHVGKEQQEYYRWFD